jgi:hypothetical protein
VNTVYVAYTDLSDTPRIHMADNQSGFEALAAEFELIVDDLRECHDPEKRVVLLRTMLGLLADIDQVTAK